jgi:hypothetical protein
MAQSTDQITLGGGVLYVADYGEAMPTDLTAVPAGNWVAIGYTDAGAVLDIATTTAEARVDELFYPVAEAITGQTASLSASIAQFTFENLQRALNGGTITVNAGPPVTNTFQPPAPDGVAAFAALFVFTNRFGFNSHLRMPQVRNVASLSTTFQTADAVIRQIPLELKMYPDSSITDGSGNELPFEIEEYESAS